MQSITELPMSELRDAGDAIETLIELRACLPPDGMLVMLAGRLRDDIRDMLGMKPLERVDRGSEVKPLEDLPGTDLDRLDKAVGVLLGRYTRFIDDPELLALLTALQPQLSGELFRRAQLEAVKAS